ncbi:MAG: SDR family oxidoreductase [Deltaproteobacteria bacterium]|nr:SDR family oxidoreductase [Deltaproteobacteria bacterium]
MRLKDKVAIITGGGGKIAKAYALGMVGEGAKVCLTDVMGVEPLVESIRQKGGEAVGVQCDVTDETSVKNMIQDVVKRFGGVDVLVNNAAYFTNVKRSPFWDMEVAEFDKAMAVNVRGVWLCAKAAFPYLKNSKKGKIINISSGSALVGNTNYIHYVSSKGAVIAMTRAMAKELGDYGICVNSIAPGRVVTEGRQVDANYESILIQQRCIKRSQVEADLVGTVIFLASSESDFMTGQLLNVDGGMTFL